MSLPVAILCGGKGTRLGELTRSCPKSLVEVAGEPFIAHQLRLLAKAGLTNVMLFIGHLGEQIRQVVGDGSRYGVRVRYSGDGPFALGTLGAIKKGLSILGDAFFVMYGDSYLECDYAWIEECWRQSGKSGLLTFCRGGAAFVDYGLAILTPRALNIGDFFFYEMDKPFREIGSPEGLAATRAYLESKRQSAPSWSSRQLNQLTLTIDGLLPQKIDAMTGRLAALKHRGGRLFILGNGGSAANASHAVNDFRKVSGIEAYAPTDNVSELTARANDDGWDRTFVDWLTASRLTADDAVLVLSVGGGSEQTSPNLVRALEHAKATGATILGIVGLNGGYTAKVADCCVIVPTVDAEMVTAHTESMQGVILHLLANHPALKMGGGCIMPPQKAAGQPRAVFLDRDGTLIDEKTHEILSGVREALKRLKAAGYLLILVTNQPGIARKTVSAWTVAVENTHLFRDLGLYTMYVCPHDDVDHCDCRKPKPGLLLRAAKEHGIDLSQSYMIGDRNTDMEAGKSAGCRNVLLVGSRWSWSFQEAVSWILSDGLTACA